MVQMRNKRLIKKKTIDAMASGVGPISYSQAARPTITFNDLRQIDSVGDCRIHCNDGVYIAKPYSIAGNILTFAVQEGQNGASREIPTVSAVNLSGITFYGQVKGQ